MAFERKDAVEMIRGNEIIREEFMNYFLGDFLGFGVSRLVFENNFDPTTVIKIDYGVTNANVLEFETWKRVEYTEFAKWFAPVANMSACGRILMQKKAVKLNYEDKNLPTEVPAFFTDLKIDNFGKIGKNIVCVDYAAHLMWEKGMTKRMRKVFW